MRGLRIAAAVLLVLLAAWAQISWFGHIRPFGVIPNVMLVTVVAFALWSDATPALAAAIGGGLLLDLASGSDFGLHMAFYVVVALALVAGRQLGLHAQALITATVTVIVAAALYNLIVLATIHAQLSPAVLGTIGRELIADLILMALVAIAVANLARHEDSGIDLSLRRPT